MGRLLLLAFGVVAGLTGLDRLAPHTVAPLLFELERTRCGLEAKRVQAAGFDIAYLEGGAGEPLVLVHGFGADKDNFARVAAYLIPHYRVLVPDLPGFGESSRSEGVSYAAAPQAERLRAFVRAVGVERVHLGGNSMGGFVVTQYAIDHPTEVASLWLLGPAGTRAAFDSARQHVRASSDGSPVTWLAHGPYRFKGVEDPMEIFEAGMEGTSPLAPPPDSEKAKRIIAPGEEETLGWRPAVGLEVPGRPEWRLDRKLGEGGFG